MLNNEHAATGTAEADAQARDRVATLNANALVDVIALTGITIRAADFHNWRPTIPSWGDIQGITSAQILATDGNLGLFVQRRGDDTIYNKFFGHIQHFTGKVKTLHGVPRPFAEREMKKKKPSAAKVEAKRQRLAERIMALLEDCDV